MLAKVPLVRRLFFVSKKGQRKKRKVTKYMNFSNMLEILKEKNKGKIVIIKLLKKIIYSNSKNLRIY